MENKETLKVIELTEANRAPGFNVDIKREQREAMEGLNKGLEEKLPNRIARKLGKRDGYYFEYRNACPLTAKQLEAAREIMRKHYEEKLGCQIRIITKCYGACEGGYNIFYPEAK